MDRRTSTLLVLLVLLAAGSGGAVFGQEARADANPLSPARPNVSFPGPGGVTLQGYLALPPAAAVTGGSAPAVLMVHEWWGLNQDIARLADALAAQGYVVLAADTFRGRVTQAPAEAMKQVQGTPSAQIAADLDAALDYLRAHPRVDRNRVASLGFCFGGTQSMYLGTRRPDLAAVVIFYGSGPITDPQKLGRIGEAGPVLGIYGQEDGNIPVDQVRAFEKALESRGVAHTITIYPGVGHAFVKSTNFRSEEAAPGRAWRQMLDFLADNLKRGAG